MLAAPHVELPAMPRTGDDRAGQPPLTQRPPLVRADAIQSVKYSRRR